jgi:hypothetical protein
LPGFANSPALGGRKPIRRSARTLQFETLEDRIVPAAPVAVNDGVYDVYRGSVLNVAAVNGVLANDTDADPNDTLTAYLGKEKGTSRFISG